MNGNDPDPADGPAAGERPDPSTRRGLARRLEAVAGFDDPRPEFEQYRTPPEVAAGLVHEADLRGDLSGPVVDLGTGTGMLALAAALRTPAGTVGLERDPAALAVARGNETRIDPPLEVDWILGDGARPPLSTGGRATVLMNPPFGAHAGAEHADRRFLAAAARLAAVSYSIHNAGSREFLKAFAADEGGRVTDGYAVELDLDRRFDWHGRDRTHLEAEAYRVDWDRAGGPE